MNSVQTVTNTYKLVWVFTMCMAISACLWTTPVSVTSTGLIAGAVQEDSGISGNGRYVVFSTIAGLVPSDTNSIADVYRYDTFTGSVLLVSTTTNGTVGNAASKQPSISDDGARVVFTSNATNFDSLANGFWQIYVRDIPAGTTTAATIKRGYVATAGNSDSVTPSISGDGFTVAFSSKASNLIAGDTNGVYDIYTYGVVDRKLSRPVVGMGGAMPNGPSTEPSINGDGTMIAFTSQAFNLVSGDGNWVADVFTVAKNGSIARISAGVLGAGNGPSGQPSIAAVANVVSFSSAASNLVADDTNGVTDVFVRGPGLEIQRISPLTGPAFNEASRAPSISSTGSRVAFLTGGANIGQSSGLIAVVADLDALSLYALSTSLTNGDKTLPATHVSISADGDYASFNSIAPLDSSDTNNKSDVVAKFLYKAKVWPWSLSPGKVQAGTVTSVTISGDDFRVNGVVPTISVLGMEAITFSDVAVVNANTITATMSIPASVLNNQYQLLVETPGGGPGPGKGSTQFSASLTVADPDPAADLVDIASSIGLPGADGGSAGLLVDDLNDDGFDDILYIRHEPTEELLFLGDGSSVSMKRVMVSADRHNCASADVNGDGFTDLYCSVGAGKGENGSVGYNNLWLQQADRTYVDAAAAWGVTDRYGRGREVVFLHANNDGWPDLFVSNGGPRPDGKASINQLFINNGGASFSPAPEFGVDSTIESLCALTADFNNDGYDDLIVCAGDRIRMYANQAGAGFVDVAARYGFTRRVVDADFADIDGDNDLDIALVTDTSFEIHRLRPPVGNPPFNDGVVFFRTVASGKSVAFGDINGDDIPDAFFVQRGCTTKLEQNLPDILAVGNGAKFTVLNPPDMTRGCGDAITVFDHDGDGRDGFLVGNGRGRRGPLQYLVLP